MDGVDQSSFLFLLMETMKIANGGTVYITFYGCSFGREILHRFSVETGLKVFEFH